MCPETHFSSVVGQLRKKARSPLHNVGSISRSDHLRVCRVSAMMITLSFTFMSCNKNVSRERTPDCLSVSSFENGTYEKKTSGSFAANSLFNLVTESSVHCSPFFPGSNIFEKCPTAIVLSSAMYMIVLPCGMVSVSKLHMV